MICGHHLETLNFIFEFVFCKWSPIGQWSMQRGACSLDLLVLLSPATSVGWVLGLPLPETAQLLLLTSISGGGMDVVDRGLVVKHTQSTLWCEAPDPCEGLHSPWSALLHVQHWIANKKHLKKVERETTKEISFFSVFVDKEPTFAFYTGPHKLRSWLWKKNSSRCNSEGLGSNTALPKSYYR